MKTLNDYIREYKSRIEAGDIQKAYQSLIKYMMNLKTYLSNKYPDDFQTGHLHQGYMDITYFSFTPLSLKNKKLKIGIGFNHEKIQFGIWLSGQNRQIQKEYWILLKNSIQNKYSIPPEINESFSIVESILVEFPDFDDLNLLTKDIETQTLKFIKDITEILD